MRIPPQSDFMKLKYCTVDTTQVKRAKFVLHRPGIEPGPPAWQASILPLNQRCFDRRRLLKGGINVKIPLTFPSFFLHSFLPATDALSLTHPFAPPSTERSTALLRQILLLLHLAARPCRRRPPPQRSPLRGKTSCSGAAAAPAAASPPAPSSGATAGTRTSRCPSPAAVGRSTGRCRTCAS